MSVSLCLSRAIFSYRLGYTPQHPYPWRWMTPIAICVFLMLSGFLAALNVPLSAYNIDQEFTYRPNDTLPPLPLSNMLPELLQHPTNGFTPQILAVGDVIQLNNSVFNYTIMEAFDALDNSQPVSSFSYYNNPFSDGCDVTNMTVNLAIGPDANNDQVIDLIVDFTVSVNCRIPTLFTMIWSGTRGITSIPLQTGINPARDDFNNLSSDMGSVFLFWPRPSVNTSEIPDGGQLTTLRVTVLPCCNCGVDSSTEPAGDDSDPTQAPCGLLPARLQATQLYIEHSAQPIPVTFDGPNSTDIFSGLPSTISDYFNNTPVSALNDVFQNTFQSLYHLARMELGVIVENQIYASPEMYNNSISPVYIPGFESSTPVPPSNYLAANTSRISTSNATLMSEWIASVRSFNESDRVPVMLYPRSVPRLKPLGSAITSVFVSTFAMLSTLWTIFSMVAAALARSYADRRKNVPFSESGSMEKGEINEGWDPSEISILPHGGGTQPHHPMLGRLSLSIDNSDMQTNIAVAEMQLAMMRMHRSLRKHGLLQDVEEINASGMGVEHNLKDRHSLISHRATDRGYVVEEEEDILPRWSQ